MKLKKIEKFAIILTGLLFLTLTLYFLLCPVRTVGEVLAKDNLDSPDEIRINPTAPKSWSACDPFADLEFGEGIWLSESEEIKEFCNLLYSLKIRKKMGKSHWFSQKHSNEPAYEYEILFHTDQGYLSNSALSGGVQLSNYLVTDGFSSYNFNTYYMLNNSENAHYFNQIFIFLSEKISKRKETAL